MVFEFFEGKSWKKASDDISKGYNDNQKTVEIKGKGIRTTLPGNPTAEITSKFTNKGDASCSTETTFKLTAPSYTIQKSIDSAQVFKHEVTINLDDQLAGLKFNVKSDNNGGRKGNCPFSSSRIGFAYGQEAFMVEAGVDPLGNNALDFTVAGGADGFAAGAQAKYSLGESKLHCYNLGLGYQTDGLTLRVNAGTDKSKDGSGAGLYGFDAFCASVHHVMIKDQLCFAAQYSNCFITGKACTALAAVYKADAATTLRAKLNNEGICHFATDFKNSDFSSLNVTARVNMKTLDGAAFGWGITFEK